MIPKFRLFVAVPLPEQVRLAVSAWQNVLKRDLPFAKWVHPDDLHITLLFIGNVNAERLHEVRAALDAACTGASGKTFNLQLGKLGTFGKKQSPSVLWADIQGELAPLGAIQRRVETAMQDLLGIEPEQRAYKPHLTLARTYNGTWVWSPELMRLHPPTDEASAWRCDEVVLYRSHLGQTPMYEPVSKHSLD
ncbi:RNA 2',3'-cyclic phosphodiesterase [Paenibacillus validus]|uniref:RNA 2',3'-cyclic phosphodiesterase n=1 Tax=Paenibacillus validus TaxID=44253 RepID=UPI0006D03C74